MAASIHMARIACDETTARHTAERLIESGAFEGAAFSAFEDVRGDWRVEIYFPCPPDRDGVRRAIGEINATAARHLTFEELASRDWVAESLAGLGPVAAGRFVVHGAHDRARCSRFPVPLQIEASLAFGTGHHGTTRGCLLALDRLVKRRRPVRARRRGRITLDVGTGTGVLALAAAKALRAPVLASDIDATAVRVAEDNARINGARAYVRVVRAAGLGHRDIGAHAPYDLVFANILLSPLRRLAAPLARLVKTGGRVVLSGLLSNQAQAAISAYRSQGLALDGRIDIDGWTTLILRHGR